jgi:glycosyltransferase involved in cell wall biosynthesis
MTQLNILKYPWHIGHDYELAKLPHNFLYLSDTYRSWVSAQRPQPSNISWTSGIEDVDADMMILHLDQWSFHEPAKRFLFKGLKDRFHGPKVVIIHGCNMLDGCTSEQMQELVEGCYVVVNSQTSLDLWGLDNSRFILHGMSPEEWPQTDYTNKNVVMVQPHTARHAVTRNDSGIQLAEQRLSITWVGRDIHCSSFDDYRKFLSSSSVYFNPSFASANPRSRAEAMLCGLVVVTTDSHGEGDYIENGVNGYCSNDISELTEFILYLLANPEELESIGRRGRETAQEMFHIDRFSSQWCGLIQEAIAQ